MPSAEQHRQLLSKVLRSRLWHENDPGDGRRSSALVMSVMRAGALKVDSQCFCVLRVFDTDLEAVVIC